MAGAGKSWECNQRLLELLNSGVVEPRDILITSFNKANTHDIIARLEDSAVVEAVHGLDWLVDKGQFGDEGVTIRTFNSICYNLVRGDEEFQFERLVVMDRKSDEEVFQQFFEECAPQFEYRYVPPAQVDEAVDSGSIPVGNQILRAYNYLRALGYGDTPEEYRAYSQMETQVAAPESSVIEVMRQWDEWKQANEVIQHDDCVRGAIELEKIPQGKVLVIDEFQDLSPLQYRLYKLWRDSQQFVHVIIAGDEAQAIYGFRGTTGRYLRETDCDESIELSESRRCAPKIVEKAQEIIAGYGYFDSTLSSYRKDSDGVVETVPVAGKTAADLRPVIEELVTGLAVDSSVMILGRTNLDVQRVSKALNELGYPNQPIVPADSERRIGLWYWESPATEILHTLRRWRTGERLYPAYVEVLLSIADVDHPWVEHAVAGKLVKYSKADEGYHDYPQLLDGALYSPDLIDEVFDVPESTETVLNCLRLEDARRDVLRRALDSEQDIRPDQIRVGTIHSAKGQEGSRVLLLAGYSHQQAERYRYEPGVEEEERRLYHVAATRAADRLCIVTGWNGSEPCPVFL
jgi:superfamily I DNA/RNA helicase